MYFYDSRGYGDFFNMGEYSRMGYDQIKKKISIFDTTLRDGEQTPGVSFSMNQKYEIATKLNDAGVNIIEAGFPAVSPDELKTVKHINRDIGNICSLARCNRNDIDRVIESGSGIIHLFIATSDIHMQYKLAMSREQVFDKIIESVEYAKSHGLNVIFSPEDATRTNMDFMERIIRAIDVDTVNFPDTIGIMNPMSMYYFIMKIKEFTHKKISVHCHNDFGMATANTLAGIMAGADEVQVTINGIGERAGNASLEEVVSAIYGFSDSYTDIKMEKLYSISEYVACASGVIPQKNKAITGENAFSHEAGIHVHGIINNPKTYEAINPEIFGVKRRIVIGKHSGKAAVKYILESRGIYKTEDEINNILKIIKNENRTVDDEYLLQVVNNE
ncbi:MAG: homoaconitate hydratase [Ferroplasma sp.]|uniref:homocitrate synthase/isopropylmalate synthase family protein n=1 Tax=Ferroplasma sp. TaxID=2591003 RepID=UPI002814CD93|nr:homoaconitate hydratase [Ferroplasma sp.]WMT51565.1 MAG: homoaconitate hydratase [Ferroplasma sp.]